VTVTLATRPKNARVFARDEFNWYVEPQWVTNRLLCAESFTGPIWDPACGSGNIPASLISNLANIVYATDIVDRQRCYIGDAWHGTFDFLADDTWPFTDAVNIITNPPYYRAKGTEDFICKSLKYATGKIAIFADLRFLSSQRRASGLFAEWPPTRIWMLGQRPSCPPGDWIAAGNKAKGGTADYAWLVWDQKAAKDKSSKFGWLL